MPSVARFLEKNLNETKSPDFVDGAIAHLTKVKAKVVRVHVAGDLYDIDYAKKWLAIFAALPDTRFFIYTRSWRIKSIRPTIAKMAKCKNVRMWWSVDKDTGKPRNVPKNIRLAYMQVDLADVPGYHIDLVFRTDNLYKHVAKKVSSAMVCPVENGITKDMNCMKCGFCYRDHSESIDWSNTRTKIELTVLAG